MMRALTFAGFLLDDGRFELEPGFVVDADVPRQKGDLIVEVRGDDRRTPVVSRIPLHTPCAPPSSHGAGGALARCGVGLVAFPDDAVELRVVHEGQVVFQQRAPDRPTTFDVKWPRLDADSPETIAWNADAKECRVAIGYSNDGGRSWQPLSPPTTEREIVIDPTTLPGGKECLLQLIGTDGFTTTTMRSDAVAVREKGWVVWILAPAPGQPIQARVPITLAAQGYHLEARKAGFDGIEWTSSLDGPLGSGAHLPVALSAGEHRLTA
jgi:hypothetical protein